MLALEPRDDQRGLVGGVDLTLDQVTQMFLVRQAIRGDQLLFDPLAEVR